MPVTDADIRRVLGVAAVRRRPWPYVSSLPIEQVDVDGPPARRMLFKDLTGAAALPRPAFMADPTREIIAYRDVLAASSIDAPAYVASVATPDRAWLFVELVDGRPLWQVGDLGVWQAAARRLARMHAEPIPQAAGLLEYDAEHLRRRLELAAWLPNGSAIADRVSRRLATLPRCLIHGEFYPANVMIQGESGDVRIRPVDWETAGLGPAVLDLAALTAGSWSSDDRRAIEDAYRGACIAAAAPDEDDLDMARLLLAAQWSGWSEGWQAPPGQRRDWRGDVRMLVERLGL
jgi:aminoglycoside phosphotransferase (APT) family kinase protein